MSKNGKKSIPKMRTCPVPNLQTYKRAFDHTSQTGVVVFLLMYSVAGKRRTSGYPSSSSKRYKGSYGKKSYRKKTSGVRQSTYGGGIVRMPYSRAFNSNPFPPKLYNTLRYSEQVIINTSDSLNGCGSYLFQANNLYDPNYTGTGHQPPLL